MQADDRARTFDFEYLGEHEILSECLSLAQIFKIEGAGPVIGLHETRTGIALAGRRPGNERCSIAKLPDAQHARRRAAKAQIAHAAPICDVMTACMPRPRVARHLVGIKPGPFAQGPRDLHAIGLEILVRKKRGVARDAIGKRRSRFDRERVDRDVIRMGRECPLERTVPASRMLPWKAAHEVARYGKPRTSRKLNCLKRHRCRMEAPDGGKLVILKALHAERDARHAGSGKASRKLLMKRLGIRLAGELLGRAPGAHAADEPG